MNNFKIGYAIGNILIWAVLVVALISVLWVTIAVVKLLWEHKVALLFCFISYIAAVLTILRIFKKGKGE